MLNLEQAKKTPSENPLQKDALSTRFAASARVYGQQRLSCFQRRRVLIAGIGGVGSWAVEALARNGIGSLVLLDHDVISLSNINRQIHSLQSTIGQKKITVMQERIAQINPQCEVRTLDIRLDQRNIADIVPACQPDFVIDAIDQVAVKAALIAWCKHNQIQIITTGGAGGLTDPVLARCEDLSRVTHNALAAKVRYCLRREYGFAPAGKKKFGIPCVYSPQQVVYPQADGSISRQKPVNTGLRLDCYYGYGSTVCVTAAFGLHAASWVLDNCLE